MPQTLILDLDDTLVHSTAAYAVAQAAAGLPESTWAAARTAVKARLPREHVAARNRLLYLKQAQPRFAPADLLAQMQAYEGALEAHLSQQWQRLGRPALLGDLARRHRLIVLTNENARTQMLKMRALDPHGSWCHACITSEEIGYEKPHPAMLQAALQAAAAPAADCVMVGDSLAHDILPARQLGCRAVWTQQFTPSAATPPADVETIADLGDLPRLLR